MFLIFPYPLERSRVKKKEKKKNYINSFTYVSPPMLRNAEASILKWKIKFIKFVNFVGKHFVLLFWRLLLHILNNICQFLTFWKILSCYFKILHSAEICFGKITFCLDLFSRIQVLQYDNVFSMVLKFW